MSSRRTAAPRSLRGHARTSLHHLPRDRTSIKPERCTACGSEDLLVDEVLVSEAYDFVRAYLRIRRTERTTCTCKACDAHIVPEPPPMLGADEDLQDEVCEDVTPHAS